ncbi:MAG: hypothetical protein JRG67_01930 [Deltaproteobacteria bacterium]|nr:hypothetical protein [Deltaproteobacteria bacterium]
MADGFEIDIDKELAAFEAKERAQLGLEDNQEQWTDSMVNAFFSAKERATTTILNGGLTMAHEQWSVRMSSRSAMAKSLATRRSATPHTLPLET